MNKKWKKWIGPRIWWTAKNLQVLFNRRLKLNIDPSYCVLKVENSDSCNIYIIIYYLLGHNFTSRDPILVGLHFLIMLLFIMIKF